MGEHVISRGYMPVSVFGRIEDVHSFSFEYFVNGCSKIFHFLLPDFTALALGFLVWLLFILFFGRVAPPMGLSYCVVITRRTEEIIDVAFCPVFGEICPLRIRAIFACQFAVLIGADCVRLLAFVKRDSVGCFTDHIL